MRSQLGMRKLDKQYTEGRKIGWNIYGGCHQKQLASNFYNINGQEEVEDSLTFEDGTG
jgi:hypothetical protein